MACGTEKIVICADDDQSLLRMVQNYLEACGYVVLAASSASSAIQLASTTQAAYAIVVDCNMPDAPMGETCLGVRRLRPELPIIMFSGSYDVPQRILENVDNYIHKRDGVQALVRALEHAGKAHRLQYSTVRRHVRYAVNVSIKAIVDRGQGATVLQGTATTFGEGGLGGSFEGEVLPGETVALTISDPVLAAVQPMAQVRYRHRDVYGLAFINMSDQQQAAIRDACQRIAVG